MQGDFILLLTILVPMAAAPLCWLAGRKYKQLSIWFMGLVSAACLAAIVPIFLSALRGEYFSVSVEGICSLGIVLRTDGFRALYALIAGVMWLFTSLVSIEYFAKDHNAPRYAFFTLLNFGATMGVMLSDNLFTAFLFFEVMSLSSYPWVAHIETGPALRAAETYLYIAIIGGLCMLAGLLQLPGKLATAGFDDFASLLNQTDSSALWLPCMLLLIGFGAKAGAFPLHVWMPKAYPAAPAPASALLSGMLSKTGVFGVLVLSMKLMTHSLQWGKMIFWLGMVTLVIGAIIALLSNDLKRVLAGSSMSQIGFIFVGIGLCVLLDQNNGFAAWGTVAHMVNHSLFKLILFLCAGVVFINLDTTNLSDIRGFGRRKPLLHLAFLSAMLGICGVPYFSGFVSKSLLHESIKTYITLVALQGGNTTPYVRAEWLFLFGGAMTYAYMFKIYVCLFLQTNPAKQETYDGMKHYRSPLTALVLIVCALLPPILGSFPVPLVSGIGKLGEGFLGASNRRAISIFDSENIIAACKSFVIGVALYTVIVRPFFTVRTADGYHKYPNCQPAWLDLENVVYRPLLRLLIAVGLLIARVFEKSTDTVLAFSRRALLHVGSPRTPVPGGNRFTYAVGSLMDAVVKILNYTLWRKRPVQPNFVYALAAGNEEVSRQSRRLTRSISFSLLMFCIGLFITIAYLVLF
ncbi:MAG: proton-conducting transporter membrane subunit [Eubacteriales bacterium]|nr:proton-conducting transporter membrane subunit [Eubacteriales bacterium]